MSGRSKSWCVVAGFILLLAVNVSNAEDKDIDDADEDEDDEPEVKPSASAPKGADVEAEEEEEDNDDAFYDPEEFEGFQTQQSQKSQKQASAQKTKKAPSEPKTWHDFYPEIGGGVLLVLFAINYFIGRSTNSSLVTVWYRGAMAELEKHWALLGDEGDSVPQLLKESQSWYKFYASGRVNAESLLVNLELQKRHDLFSLLFSIFKPDRDLVTMEITMPDEALDNFILAVVSKRDEKAVKADNPDLERLTRKVTVPGLPDTLVCLTDNPELVSQLLVPVAVSTLATYESFVKCIHFSDRLGEAGAKATKRGIRFTLFLSPRRSGGKDDSVAAMENLTRLAMGYIDKCASIKLSVRDKDRAKQLRNKADLEGFKSTAKSREEEAQRRKAQKIQELKAQRAALSPEEQARFDERMAKKAEKKKSNQFKVMKLKS